MPGSTRPPGNAIDGRALSPPPPNTHLYSDQGCWHSRTHWVAPDGPMWLFACHAVFMFSLFWSTHQEIAPDKWYLRASTKHCIDVTVAVGRTHNPTTAIPNSVVIFSPPFLYHYDLSARPLITQWLSGHWDGAASSAAGLQTSTLLPRPTYPSVPFLLYKLAFQKEILEALPQDCWMELPVR